ncbi:MAG: NFACT RNA binding domain-containing protein [Myxococcota bacterium]
MGNAPHPARPVPNLSEALDLLCLGKDSGEALAAARRGALRALAALITHRTRKLERQRADLGRAAEGERWRAQADLLLAQGNSARRGLASLVVADVFDESAPEVTILLDPAMTLAENAGRLYKRAQKAKRGLARLAQVIARGEAELRYLREQKLHAELAEDRETLDAIAASLGKKAKRAPARARGEKARVRGAAQEGGGGPRRFSLRGWEVIVGRHGRDNDQIVTRIGSPRDLWFHARGVPGAHVLLRRPGRDSPDARVQESAARIAAHYSQARGDARADVIVADLKQVRKPRGMPPGQVMVRESRTLRVAPGLPAGLAPLGGNDPPASGGATGRRRGSGAR